MIPSISTSDSLEQIVDRIFASRQITRRDQYHLLSLQSLSTQEQALINRLFDRLRMGLVKVVD